MARTLTAELRESFHADLRQTLDAVRVQDLREIARNWGWPLKGTAKADLTEQMMGYLSDPVRMAAGFARLPGIEQETLIWVTVTEGLRVEEGLRQMLRLAGGQSVTVEEVSRLLQDLFEHGLVFPDANGGWHMPPVYIEWLPETDAPGLAHSGALQAIPVANMEDVSREVERLLGRIEKDRPQVASQGDEPAGQPKPYSSIIQARDGLLPRSTWAHWGYGVGEDYDRARLLLELMVSQGLCRVVDLPKGSLVPWPSALAAWQDLSPGRAASRDGECLGAALPETLPCRRSTAGLSRAGYGPARRL